MRWRRGNCKDDSMIPTNLNGFSAKESNEIVEQAVYDLDDWYFKLINNDINIVVIIGMLEAAKHSLLNGMIEVVNDD